MEHDYAELIKALRFAFEQPCYDCVLGEKCNWGDFCFFKRSADAIEELLAKCVNFGDGECDSTQLCTCYGIVRAQINLLKSSVPKWISVEERLPEGNGTRYEYDLEESNLVLVYGINNIGEMAYGLGRYIYDHDDPKDSGWNGNMDCDYDLDYCTVTHWMPLPEASKEVE